MFRKQYHPAPTTAPTLPIDIPSGIRLTDLIGRVEAFRGKPMRILEVAELEGESLCGLWLATETEDLVLHAPSASPLHREQFILHEFAHMLLRHDENPKHAVDAIAGTPAAPDATLVELADGPVMQVMARDGFEHSDELEAETLADHLAHRLRHRRSSKFSEVFG